MEEFKGYYKKNRDERIEILKKNISKESYKILKENVTLDNEIADKIIENQISVMGMPYGIATNFLINGEEILIPMCTEEASVIAAASNAAGIIKKNGGIKAELDERIMIGQIAYYNRKNSIEEVLKNKEKILEIANLANEGITKIGGGAVDLEIQEKSKFTIIYLYVDTKDAMGANTINTMLEVIENIIKEMLKAEKLMSILSNYATRALVKASCKLKLDKALSEKICLAYEFANADIYRASTNNKGIFNGIDALAIATANDFRAIEAGAHAYASRKGKYQSLTKWYMKDEYLIGEIEMPMPIATVGGNISINPLSKVSLDILNNPDAKKLAMIAVSLGLAQNFAALKALVTEGIQKGHMKLHAKSIAIFAGAVENEIDYVVDEMIKENKIEIEIAKKILRNKRNESNS